MGGKLPGVLCHDEGCAGIELGSNGEAIGYRTAGGCALRAYENTREVSHFAGLVLYLDEFIALSPTCLSVIVDLCNAKQARYGP